MSMFSEHLERCIMDSGLTENQLARISGFNRSYIALMKNGQRVSPDAGKMKKLLETLNLPPQEFDLLWREYIRARMGEDTYERNRAVIDLMESFGNISRISIKSFYQHEIPGIKTVENHMDLIYMVRAVMEQEAMRQDGYIRIIMQADIPILSNILPGLCQNNKQLRIDHIICMNQNTGNDEKQEQLYNIRMLKYLMPIVVFGNSKNYKVYHFYDSVKSHFSKTSLLPYMVLTQEYVICMNVEMTKGIIYREREFLDLFGKLFSELKQSCRMLLKRIEDESEIFQYHASGEYMGDVIYTIAQQPCFGMLKVDGLVRKYYRQGNEPYRVMLENALKKNEKIMSSGQIKIVSYCTKTGLQRFAENGIVDEIPGEVYRTLELQDRKNILKNLLEMIETGKYELYLLEESEITFPKELFIVSYGIADAILMYLSEKEKARFLICETSLTKIIYDFFQDIVRSPQISDEKKAVHVIRRLIEKMENSEM